MKNLNFSKRIKGIMQAKGVKTRELSKLIGCPEVTINMWKSGVMPKSSNQKKLAEALEVSPAYLIFGEDADTDTAIFANENDSGALRSKIEMHLKQLMDEAERYPHALEHLYMELRLRFPKKIYENNHANRHLQ